MAVVTRYRPGSAGSGVANTPNRMSTCIGTKPSGRQSAIAGCLPGVPGDRGGKLVRRLQGGPLLAEEHGASDLEVVAVRPVQRVEVQVRRGAPRNHSSARSSAELAATTPRMARVDVAGHVPQVRVGHQVPEQVACMQHVLSRRRCSIRCIYICRTPGCASPAPGQPAPTTRTSLASSVAAPRQPGGPVPQRPRGEVHQRVGEQRRHVGRPGEPRYTSHMARRTQHPRTPSAGSKAPQAGQPHRGTARPARVPARVRTGRLPAGAGGGGAQAAARETAAGASPGPTPLPTACCSSGPARRPAPCAMAQPGSASAARWDPPPPLPRGSTRKPTPPAGEPGLCLRRGGRHRPRVATEVEVFGHQGYRTRRPGPVARRPNDPGGDGNAW